MNHKLRRIHKRNTFASLPDMMGRRRRKIPPLPLLPAGDDLVTDVTDDFEQEVARALQDDRLAKRVVSLIQTKHPYGTVPEMIMLDFLEEKGERYKYQAQLFGGWRQGGIIPDFLVRGNALFIQGVYWHNIPERRQKDASDKLRVLGQYFDGELIERATFVWEDKLMGANRRAVMELALQGIELPA